MHYSNAGRLTSGSTAFTIHESIGGARRLTCAIRNRERRAPRVILGFFAFLSPAAEVPGPLIKAMFGGRI
jgi:hypothetical protein